MTTNTSADAASALALQRLILDEDLEHLEDLLAAVQSVRRTQN